MPETAIVVIVFVATAAVLGCLRTIGAECDRVVRWHDLRVEVQRLRLEHQKRLADLEQTYAREMRTDDAVPVPPLNAKLAA